MYRPHLEKFYWETRGTKCGYIFRIKYEGIDAEKGKIRSMAIGTPRMRAKKIATFWARVQQAYETFEIKLLRSYFDIMLNSEIFVTGFTVEVITKGKYP